MTVCSQAPAENISDAHVQARAEYPSIDGVSLFDQALQNIRNHGAFHSIQAVDTARDTDQHARELVKAPRFYGMLHQKFLVHVRAALDKLWIPWRFVLRKVDEPLIDGEGALARRCGGLIRHDDNGAARSLALNQRRWGDRTAPARARNTFGPQKKEVITQRR